MPVTLNFGNNYNYDINVSRLARLMNPDKDEALYMGTWDKFKDLFRENKKQHVLEVLHTLLHGGDNAQYAECEVDIEAMAKIHAFGKLKQFADPAHRDRFAAHFDADQTHVMFSIDREVINKCSLRRILNITHECDLKPMEEEEADFFLEVCFTYGKYISKSSEWLALSASKLKTLVNEDEGIKDKIYELMRPEEDRHAPFVNWSGMLTEEEQKKLFCLNMCSFEITTQFCKIGYKDTMWYKETNTGIVFEMLHPTLFYLLQGYRPSLEFKEMNSHLLALLAKDYSEYHDNKEEIDHILKRIYLSHGRTLYIGVRDCCRNMLL
ncbi:type III secretion system effector SopD2 [Salmonella enterica subsp. salamae]|nr:type III secretion system effector SopD2 [Salmonella enterica subsp. salamae]ECJ2283142.1 type III secretion system effector SopD2 [Salmonella enterica subsp. salamae]HCC0889970.1 type III secretion system effector SopD2 [Salmonella enterica]